MSMETNANTVRKLTETELKVIDVAYIVAKKNPVTLAQQIEVLAGRLKTPDLVSAIKFQDNIWVALTLEEVAEVAPNTRFSADGAGHVWHLSVSVRGKNPPDDLLYSITDRLRFDRSSVTLVDDARHGPLVRHAFASEVS